MELPEYMLVLRRRWLSVVAICLTVLAAATVVMLLMTPKFTATTQLFFAVQGAESVSDLAQGSVFTEQQMVSYAKVTTSPLVLSPVIKELGLPLTTQELAKMVSAESAPGTVILDIHVTDADPQRAVEIADRIGGRLTSVAADLIPERQDGSSAVRATILAPAVLPNSPSSPLMLRNILIALAAGLLLGVGAAFFRHLMDTKIRNVQDVRGMTDSAVLGVVPFDVLARSHPVAMHPESGTARGEAMQRLRVNLQFVELANRARSLVISSSIPKEGKSVTAINLAIAMADAGSRVILVDANLREPSIGRYLGIGGGVGLVDVLTGTAELADAVHQWKHGSLDVLPAGPVPANPGELLGSKAMSSTLEALLEGYDMVLFDTPSILVVPDAIVLGKIVGGTLLVVGVDQLRRPQLRDTLEAMATVKAHLLGVVLNKVAVRDTGAYVHGLRSAPVWPDILESSVTAKDQSARGASVVGAESSVKPIQGLRRGRGSRRRGRQG